jgi:hypothetical protein
MSSEIKANKISPATGTAITLGDSGDTFTVPSGVTLTNNGTASGFGKVLQVVHAAKSDTSSTNSGTAVTTGLEASITPSATSSKVLVNVSFAYQSQADVNTVFQLYRDSTAIHLSDAAGNRLRTSVGTRYQGNNNDDMYNGSINALDSPSSTSSITYKLMFFRGYTGNSNYVYLNYSPNDANNNSATKRSISSITLMEIGA